MNLKVSCWLVATVPVFSSLHGVQRTGNAALGVAPQWRDGHSVCILFPRGCYIYVYCFGCGAPPCLCARVHCLFVCESTVCVCCCLLLASWPKSSNENNMLTKGWPQSSKMTTVTFFLCLCFLASQAVRFSPWLTEYTNKQRQTGNTTVAGKKHAGVCACVLCSTCAVFMYLFKLLKTLGVPMLHLQIAIHAAATCTTCMLQ